MMTTRSESREVKTSDNESNHWNIAWSDIPHTTRVGIIPFLQFKSCLSLDLSMTNHEARPHLVKSYEGMRSPAFDRHLYTSNNNFMVLRWVMKRGIDLRGFRLVVGGERGSGKILRKLMNLNQIAIAEYYVIRGELNDVKEPIGGTVIHQAASLGHLAIVKGLVQAGVDINTANGVSTTSLNAASRENFVEIVQFCIDAGADKDKADAEGWTPLYSAAYYGHVEVVQALVKAGADLNKANTVGRTPLTIAVQKGHIKVVKALVAGGEALNVNQGNFSGSTALHSISHIEAGQTIEADQAIEAIQALVNAGADVNMADNWGRTSLHRAAEIGRVEVVQAFLHLGASLNKADNEGWTPLYAAAWWGRTEVVRAFLDAGVDLETRRFPRGKSPLDVAKEKGYREIVFLLEHAHDLRVNM
jgi:ankyrin repeat protein